MKFRETHFCKELRCSMGYEVDRKFFFLSIFVTTGHADYNEYFIISQKQYEKFQKRCKTAASFVKTCTKHGNDKLLIFPAQKNRGVLRLPFFGVRCNWEEVDNVIETSGL